MIKAKVKETLFYKILFVVLGLVLIGMIASKLYQILLIGTPKEFREMNMVIFAYDFAHGRNNYSYSEMWGEIPAPINLYGGLVPLALSGFIKIFSFFPINVLQICELITLFVEITGSIVFYTLLNRKTRSPVLSIFGSILFYGCFWRNAACGGAYPDQWGVVLFLVLMLFVCQDEKKGKYRPLLYALIVVAEFYIKQYFIFVLLGLSVYLFIQSRKDFVKFCLNGIFWGGISVLIVQKIFPLYFIEVFPMAQASPDTNDLLYSLRQIIDISVKFYPFIMLAAIFEVGKLCFNLIKKKDIKIYCTYEMCQFIFMLPLVIYIGQNHGTLYAYYLQLWYPYVIFVGIGGGK